MTSGITLEDFSTPAPVDRPRPTADDAAVKAAYERGYRQGWDDATTEAQTARDAISAELERNLRDLGFTYFEARDALLQSMSSFLDETLTLLFPTLLSPALRATILAELDQIAATTRPDAIDIMVHADEADRVRALLPDDTALTITVRPEPALAPGRAHIVFESAEIDIDLQSVVARLQDVAAPPRESTRSDEHG
ncbi:MAG: hypothetical protein AAFQ79_01365 [Pseudomonadota bacterium]